ncbi:MAG: TIGR00153 family protein [Acidiferrobacterales bacterium]
MPTGYLVKLFGKSPIRPLQEHMTRVHTCVGLLKPLFAAVVADDDDEVARLQQQITGLEHEADDRKKQLRHDLPTGLFMPVDRHDLLDVLMMQDNMANQTKDIAGLVRGRHMRLPTQMHGLFMEYVARVIDASAQALKIIGELDELLETGFRGIEVERVEGKIAELNAIESETDRLQVQLRAILFELEDDLRPTDVMFLYRLIEWVGVVADYAQRVGSRLQLLLAS